MPSFAGNSQPLGEFDEELSQTTIEHDSNREQDYPFDTEFNFRIWNERLSPSDLCYETQALSPDNLLIPIRSIGWDQRSPSDLEEARKKYPSSRGTPSSITSLRSRRGRKKKRTHSHLPRSRSCGSVAKSIASSTTSRYSSANRQLRLQQKKDQQMIRIIAHFVYQNKPLKEYALFFLRKYLSEYSLITVDDIDYNQNNTTVIKTRFAKEFQNKLLDEYKRYVFECTKRTCNVTATSLEKLTEHVVNVHNKPALFHCRECNYYYLSQEHLDKHQEKHYENYLMYCIYCYQEFRDRKLHLQHLDQHLTHSFPCIYCDSFYLTKKLCDDHIRIVHRGRKRKIRNVKPHTIMDRVDKDGSNNTENTNDTSNVTFVVKELIQVCKKRKRHEENDAEAVLCCRIN